MATTVIKRTQLTLQEKLDIIAQIDKGVSRKVISNQYKCDKSTISKIISKRHQIEVDTSKFSENRKRLRTTEHPQVDKALLEWCNTLQWTSKVPLTGPILLEKANQLLRQLGESPDHKISEAWVDRFKMRHGIRFKCVSGDVNARSAMTRWIHSVWSAASEGYATADIFNADETGLFFRTLPDKSVGLKGERCGSGQMSDERVTVLCCANATGTEKLKPVLVGKYAKPRCFRGVFLDNLPVSYRSDSKAWMTAELFADWLSEWNENLKKKQRSVLLLLDSCAAHPAQTDGGLSNIKLVFLPPNVASGLQPMEQGIMKKFKRFYRNAVLLRQIQCLDTKTAFGMTMKDVALCAGDAWSRIAAATILDCFVRSKIISRPCHSAPAADDALPDDDQLVFENIAEVAWHRGLSVPQGFTMEDFVNFDSQLAVARDSDHPVRGGIWEDGDVNDEDDTGEDDNVERKSRVPTMPEAKQMVEHLRTWTLANVEDPVLGAELNSVLGKLNHAIDVQSIKMAKQMIVEYFK